MKRACLIFSLLFSICTFAQDRPKIGIVLSGGGAKGFAHIGVLEVLDSLGIPVDAIGGTSMGSIIGGLYAIGHTPEDLSQIATTTEWDFVTNPRPERKYLAPYEKNSDERYVLTLDVTEEGLQIPGGLNPGERILNILSRETIGYHDPLDFRKDLPIPFVCVATELNTGREKVMYEGILPLCLRSSMSIPSLFSPFYYDDTYLIDGGTVNNFPADHLRELGVDILIGVDVQTTFKDSIADPTFLKVLEKTGMYMNAFTTKERESLCDLILNPDMNDFGVTTFDKAAEIIESGRRVARANMEELLRIRELLGGPQPRTVRRRLPPNRIRIDEIRVKGLANASRRNVIGNLGFSEGDTVSFDDIEQGMLKIHGTNQFSLANYLTYPFNGKTVLEVRVLEKPSGVKARVGIRYDSDFESAALLNLTSRNEIFTGSYMSLDIGISANPRANIVVMKDNGVLPGLGGDFRYWNYQSDFHYGGVNFGEMRTEDIRARLFLTSSIAKSTAIKLGVAYHNTSQYSDGAFIQSIFGEVRLRSENVELFLNSEIDIRNRNTYATKGILMELNVMFIGSLNELYGGLPFSTDINFESNIPLSKDWTFRSNLYGLVNIGSSEITPPYIVNYGGVGKNYINNNVPLYGYTFAYGNFGYATSTFDPVYGLNSAMVGFELQYEIFKNNFILGGINGAAIIDDIYTPFDKQSSLLLTGFKFEYGINTFIGPISAILHKSFESSGMMAYLNIGYWF